MIGDQSCSYLELKYFMDLESEVNSKFSASNHINIDASSLQCTSTHIQANLLPSPPQALTAMEPVGLDLDASWSCFDPSTPVDVSEFMAQFFSLQNFPNEEDQEPNTMFWPDHNAESYYCSSNSNYSSCNWTQDDCSIMPGNCKGEPSQMLPVFSHHQIDGPLCANEEASNDEAIESTAKTLLYTAHASQATKRKLRAGDVQESREDYDSQIGTTPNKNARKTKKGDRVQSKKSQRIVTSATEDESNASYSSEDDSNGSQELKEAGSMSSSLKGSLNLNQNGKKRAGRGSATDPQSLYARKRRERINERLKILQNLVPNGTKVDISTMLEEAVQYVKFLQLQIKLLSSDDLWMYAPIAYNGMILE